MRSTNSTTSKATFRSRLPATRCRQESVGNYHNLYAILVQSRIACPIQLLPSQPRDTLSRAQLLNPLRLLRSQDALSSLSSTRVLHVRLRRRRSGPTKRSARDRLSEGGLCNRRSEEHTSELQSH